MREVKAGPDLGPNRVASGHLGAARVLTSRIRSLPTVSKIRLGVLDRVLTHDRPWHESSIPALLHQMAVQCRSRSYPEFLDQLQRGGVVVDVNDQLQRVLPHGLINWGYAVESVGGSPAAGRPEPRPHRRLATVLGGSGSGGCLWLLQRAARASILRDKDTPQRLPTLGLPWGTRRPDLDPREMTLRQ